MNVMTPFFSVIIPTYNRAGFIAATIYSVLVQSFTSFEILVVDDGSKDNTAEVVRTFGDARLRYLPKENAERGAARNYGLMHARGEYAVFLDSDDLFHPNHLATLYAFIAMQAAKPNFLATKYDFEREGVLRPSGLAPLPAGPLGFETFLQGNVLACNVCTRLKNPQLYRFQEDRRYAAIEDWMFVLQNTQHGEVIHLIDALTLTMSDHDQRSMRADNQGLIRRMELAAGWMQQHLNMTLKQRDQLLGRVYYLCAIHAHIDGYQAQALRFASRAVPGLPALAGLALLARCATPPALIQWAKQRLGR